jgi:hypothetical protein
MPAWGWLMMGLGIFFTLLVGGGLMALVFYSSRAGFDEPPEVVQEKKPTRTFEKLISVKSFEQAIEIQSQYAKRTYDNWVAEASKLSEIYANMARDASRPVEQAAAKRLS